MLFSWQQGKETVTEQATVKEWTKSDRTHHSILFAQYKAQSIENIPLNERKDLSL